MAGPVFLHHWSVRLAALCDFMKCFKKKKRKNLNSLCPCFQLHCSAVKIIKIKYCVFCIGVIWGSVIFSVFFFHFVNFWLCTCFHPWQAGGRKWEKPKMIKLPLCWSDWCCSCPSMLLPNPIAFITMKNNFKKKHISCNLFGQKRLFWYDLDLNEKKGRFFLSDQDYYYYCWGFFFLCWYHRYSDKISLLMLLHTPMRSCAVCFCTR